MKRLIICVLCAFMLTATFTNCGSKSSKETSQSEATVEPKKEKAKDYYIKLAKETNKKMPMVLPMGIRQDRVEAVSKNEFKYYYTFTKDPEIPAEEFIRSAKPALSLGARESKEDIFETFKKDKMILIYAYYKMDGSLFAEVILNPEDYK